MFALADHLDHQLSPARPLPAGRRVLAFVVRGILALMLSAGALPSGVEAQTAVSDEPVLTSVQAFNALTPQERQHAWSLDLVCDVLYYDPTGSQLWVRDATGGAFVELVGEPLPMKTNQRVRVRGTLQPPIGLLVFAGVSVEVFGEVPSLAVPLENWGEVNPGLENRMVVAEGLVDRQESDPARPMHLNLFLSAQGRSLLVTVYDPALATQPRDLTDTIVRVTGVYSSRSEATAPTQIKLMVAGLPQIEVISQLTSDPRFERPAVAVEDLGRQPRDVLVRVVGRMHSQVRGQRLRLRDGTGQVEVISAQTLNLDGGDTVEAIGRPQVDGLTVRLVEGVFRRLETPVPENAAASRSEYRMTGDVLYSSFGVETGQPARLKGVVTWSHPDFPYFYMADNTGGVRVQCGPGSGQAPPLGSSIEVRGVTVMGSFAGEVLAKEILIVGKLALPTAPRRTLEGVLSGVEEAQWVSMRAYVCAIESRQGPQGLPEQVVHLATNTGDFDMMVPTRENLLPFLGTAVELQGVCAARTDKAGKLLSIELLVPEAKYIKTVEKALDDIFATQSRSLESLGQYQTIRVFGTRIRVEGTVVYVGAGRIILHDKGVALNLLTREIVLPKLGERVEAVGFLGRRGPRVVLRETVCRRIGLDDSLKPVPLLNSKEVDPLQDGSLVRVTGTVLDVVRVGPSLLLTVQRDLAIFSAQFEGAGIDVRQGAEVSLTGVYDVQYDEYGKARSFAVLLRNATDLVVTRPPSPFTTGRILAFAGVLATLALVSLTWVVALRQRVRQQTELLRAQHERENHLYQQIERTQHLESLGHLAGGIAHDFNNLLTAIMGNISLARFDVGANTGISALLEEAERAALRARGLTQQLLTFAKGGSPIRTATDLAGVVREVAEFALHGMSVRPEFRFAENLWPANVDKGQVGQVVQNLVLNGAQAMANGGRLEIELANDAVAGGDVPGLVPGCYLRLAIRDFGSGISAAALPHIFEPYFTTKSQGSGLGLATVHSIVKRHGGIIDVDSMVGRGTCFRIWLPAMRGAGVASALAAPAVKNGAELPAANGAVVRAPTERAAPARVESGAQRVLVMDDESAIRHVAQKVLQRAGYDVTAVSDGAEAVRHYTEARAAGRGFDVVIFDLTVPEGMGGRQALAELLKIDPAVRAIVSSGYSSDATLADHLKLGFAAMLPKPYEAAMLITSVRKVLLEGAA